jgi:signal transduction histidine kinase
MVAYSGKGQFRIEPVAISKITEEMGSLLEVSMSKKADLIFEMDSERPAIEADATQIGQVVMNLITNAS